MITSNVRRIIYISHPLHLLFSVLTFILGAGIARYLGAEIIWAAFWLGMLALFSLKLASYLLAEYFHLPTSPTNPEETARQREDFRVILLQTAYASLSVCGVAILTLLLTNLSNIYLLLLMGFDLALSILFAVPPGRLADRGYGELVSAFSIATIVPSVSFVLQVNEFHRILPLITFPLTLMLLANLLASDFPSFASEQKTNRITLLSKISWQRAIPAHHVLLLGSFLLFSMVPLVGIPWRLIWPVFLVLPFAAIEILWLQRIAHGGRTLWKFFLPLTSVVFGLVVYLLSTSFWMK